MFMSDLARAIDLPVEVDFMAVSSYGSATRTSGVVRIVKDLDVDLAGRHVLVVEDIVDSGLTLNYLQRYLLARQPASLEVCALLVKEGQQRTAARPPLRRLSHPAGVRRGIRARRRRALPEPPGRSTPTPGLVVGRLSRSVTVDTAAHREGDRPRAPGRHRRGPVAATGWSRPRSGWPRCTRSCSPASGEDPDRPPRRDLRGRARRDGDGPRHPLRLAVRAPPGPVHRQGPRRLHPRLRTAGSPGSRSWPASSRAMRGASRSRSG